MIPWHSMNFQDRKALARHAGVSRLLAPFESLMRDDEAKIAALSWDEIPWPHQLAICRAGNESEWLFARLGAEGKKWVFKQNLRKYEIVYLTSNFPARFPTEQSAIDYLTN